MIKIKIIKKEEATGAIVVIIDSDDKALILLRPKEASWAPGKWGYPGGKIEAGETPLETAVRETKEETQLIVKNLRPLRLPIDKPVRSFYSRDYGGRVQIDYEHDDWQWIPRSEIEKYDLAPDVLDMYDWVLQNG